MNILIIGSGGREHALAWKIKQSPQCEALYCAPGNAGISQVATCVALKSQDEIKAFCVEKKIGLVVIGPEQPLVEGLADALRAAGVPTFGPSAKAAQLEGSKAFTKSLCKKYNIPTAAYEVFTESAPALAYLKTQKAPYVIKADGLAAGKGVIIAENMTDAEAAVKEIFSGKFGEAGAKLVIEAFMEGEEVSFFALSNGKDAIAFGHAQDHKRAFDGDQGPNTGGMGTYTPVPIFPKEVEACVMKEIIHPTVVAMQKEGIPFQGVLFAGLMITREGPQLIEYNVRFGDPETQVLMRSVAEDVVPLLLWSAGAAADVKAPNPEQQTAVCVVMAAKGYPGDYQKNTVIGGLENAARVAQAEVFHAGTAKQGEAIIATGGRVLGVTATGVDVKAARENAYKAVDSIAWPEGFCRRDIAWRALKG